MTFLFSLEQYRVLNVRPYPSSNENNTHVYDIEDDKFRDTVHKIILNELILDDWILLMHV